MKKILITPRGFSKYGLDIIECMKNEGFEVHYNDTGVAYTSEEFLSFAKDADGIIVGVEKIDSDLIDKCPKLKAIVKFGVGTDNIDLEYAKKKGIFVGKTLGSNSKAVAEMTMALILADARNLVSEVLDVKNGNWNKETGIELTDQTLGLIGFGTIGKYIAKFASAFDMKVIVYDVMPIDNTVADEYHVKVCNFEEVLMLSDVISLHIPLNETTRNMISEKEFKKMKKTATLINTARGGIVVEEDLKKALENGDIRSAAFDVYSKEPPEYADTLIQMKNFILTPHIASRTSKAERNTCVISSRLIVNALKEDIV